MTRTPKGLHRWSSLAVICLISALGLKDVQTQSLESLGCLECYSCTDQGDGGCLPEKALNVSCSSEYDACVETIFGVRTSHSSHVVLKKGCGYGNITKLDNAILYNGMSIYIQLNHCKTGNFCNTDMNLKDYQLTPEANITQLPNDDQCYSCIGKPGEECSPSHAATVQCYNSYTHCFDGIATISVANDTTHIPIKSCSTRYRCAAQSLTYGSTIFEIKGACCTEVLCNDDLSNNTQVAEMPFLVLLGNDNQELTATAAPPQWVAPTKMGGKTHEAGHEKSKKRKRSL